MQNLSDQEKKVLEIMKESKQQLTPEEITAEINKRYGQVWPIQVITLGGGVRVRGPGLTV